MTHKESWIWPTDRLPAPPRVWRWGSFGAPVLLFPSAGGDGEEIERFGVVAALQPLLEAGRIKLFSVDGVAARVWLAGRASPEPRSQIQNRFDQWVYAELVPHIRRDCQSGDIGIVAGGAAFGAFNAVASLCRHPDVFKAAIGLSGRYDLTPLLDAPFDDDLYFSSPLHFLPSLGEGEQLSQLRDRYVVLACGAGRYEDPRASQQLTHVLAAKAIPNRIELWGEDYDHDWKTWRAMLEKYVPELV